MPASDTLHTAIQTCRRVVSAKPMAARVDLTGRNAVVTGGARNSIGYQVARTLAAWGADVVVTSLDDTEALERALREELRASGAIEARLTARPLDLADSRSVNNFAQWYADHCGGELHALVNNAGVFRDIARRSKTPILAGDGLEIHWRVNFLGTFHLTHALTPLLQRAGRQTGDARAVFTSSDVHRKGRNDRFFTESEGPYDSWDAYAQAKLALVHLAFEFQRRYAAEFNLQAAALHPGSVRSNLTAAGLEGQPFLRMMHRLTQPLMAPFFLSQLHGAQTTLACATMPRFEGGHYYEGCAISQASDEALDEATASRLWELGEAFVERNRGAQAGAGDAPR